MQPIAVQRGVPVGSIDFGNAQPFFFDLNQIEERQNLLLQRAEVCLCRANFKVNSDTLNKMPNLKMLGLVSTGTDNIDFTELNRRKITFFGSKGINANAVADYVKLVLAFFWQKQLSQRKDTAVKIGIIGYGEIGRRVADFLHRSRLEFAVYDPYAIENSEISDLYDCDIISVHIPLVQKLENGELQKNHHILSQELARTLKKDVRWIQTSRGDLWEETYYACCLRNGQILAQDVFPGEPFVKAEYINAGIMTPHIAGYSTIGRVGGILKVLQEMFPSHKNFQESKLPASSVWDIQQESQNFKQNLNTFTTRRDHFPWRKELFEYNEKEKNSLLGSLSLLNDAILENLFLRLQ